MYAIWFGLICLEESIENLIRSKVTFI